MPRIICEITIQVSADSDEWLEEYGVGEQGDLQAALDDVDSFLRGAGHSAKFFAGDLGPMFSFEGFGVDVMEGN